MSALPADGSEFDLVVVGGGINGCGIARDAVLRGLSVALFEMGDYGRGTTWASSGMIHGGARYLLYDPDTTKMACEDSGRIAHIASHLLYRIPFLYPSVRTTGGRRMPLRLIEIFLRLYDKYVPLKGGKQSTRLTSAECRRLEPGLTDKIDGAVTLDEWGVDAARLSLLNALDAAERGAVVCNGVAVRRFVRGAGGEVKGVQVRDRITGETATVRARCVLNATGPWSERTAAMANATVRLRPAKGVHVVYERRITNVGLMFEAIDGRQLFLIPHDRETWIGTTDDDYFGDPGDIPIHHDEIQYLIGATEVVFPEIRRYRPIRAFAGVRPTLFGSGKYEDDLSRGHRIFDHATEGAPGLMSIAGGKLAAYRVMSEETTDAIAERLSRPDLAACQTGQLTLPGAGELESPADLARDFQVAELAVRRLQRRHGSRTREVLEPIKTDRALRHVVCRAEPTLAAEVVYAVEKERARTLEDVAFRTRLGLGACLGSDCVLPAAALCAERLGWDLETLREQARDFLAARWRERAPVASGANLAAEELNRAAMLAVAGLGR